MSHEVIRAVYAAFNSRNIPAALALMTSDVHWPKASEGGSVMGKEAIHDYWTRQWQQFDPHVEPVEIVQDGGRFNVRVHQVVRSLRGELLSDSEVVHVFTLRDGLIAAMQLGGENASTPSAAFGHSA